MGYDGRGREGMGRGVGRQLEAFQTHFLIDGIFEKWGLMLLLIGAPFRPFLMRFFPMASPPRKREIQPPYRLYGGVWIIYPVYRISDGRAEEIGKGPIASSVASDFLNSHYASELSKP